MSPPLLGINNSHFLFIDQFIMCRYLKFHNNKKSRVQDFFRKLDDDGDGYCPRDEFIDGILKVSLKFNTSICY